MSTKPFYNHIAGLRGIAILLVFLFHLCTSMFPHGFYGVDIFLVISGYLLFLSFTRKGNQLDLKEFAAKKLYRIFPPMIIIVLLTLLAGMHFQDCDTLIHTSRTGRYTLFCYVNEFLRKNQGDYFADVSLSNPFLHMWYLSVTIHLYIMFAVGCVVYRFLPRLLSWILLWGIGIASFCYGYSYQLHNIIQSLGLPVWEQLSPVSHYSTLPRVWEPLAGGAILMLPLTTNKAKATLLTLVGLAAAIIPALMPSGIADYGVPLVVLGTMLIVRYMPDSCLMPILSNKLLLWMGGISFSLYLVHMPIIAYFRTWCQDINGLSDYMLISVLSLVLAWVFWFLVEKRQINKYATVALWGVGMTLCVLGKELEGFKDYIYPEINSIRVAPYDDWKFCSPDILSNQFDVANMGYNNGVIKLAYSNIKAPRQPATPLMQLGPESQTPSVLLIGDSHAQASYFGLNRLLHELNVPGVFLSTSLLPFWDRYHWLNPTYYYGREKAEALLKWLEANPCITHVFIGQYWRARLDVEEHIHWDFSKEPMNKELFFNSLKEFIIRIKALNRHVVLIGPWPEIKEHVNPSHYVRVEKRKGNLDMNLAPLTCTRSRLLELNKDIIPMLNTLEQEGLCSVLRSYDYVSDSNPFVAYKDGTFMLSDDDHLSGEGSTELFKYLRPQIEEILKESTPSIPAP